MSLLDVLYSAGVVRQGPGATGLAAQPKKFVYLTKESLTFPGVTTVAGLAASIIQNASGWTSPKLWLSCLIGGALGLFLLILGVVKASAIDKAVPGFMLEAIGVAVLNTVMLIAAIHGVAEVSS
jgi:hypothetical protein